MSVCEDERASAYPSSCKRLRLNQTVDEDDKSSDSGIQEPENHHAISSDPPSVSKATATETKLSYATESLPLSLSPLVLHTCSQSPSADVVDAVTTLLTQDPTSSIVSEKPIVISHDSVTSDTRIDNEFDGGEEDEAEEEDDENENLANNDDDDEDGEYEDEEDDDDADADDEDDDEEEEEEDDDDEDDDDDDDCDVTDRNNVSPDHTKMDLRQQYQYTHQSPVANHIHNPHVPQASHSQNQPNQMHQTHQETQNNRFNTNSSGQLNTSQQNTNWVLFHTSISKLRRSQSGPEPNLLRSVLICNLLRRLEREMDEDGIKINYGPDGVPTIVSSNQEIMIDQVPQNPASSAPQQSIAEPCDLNPAIAAPVLATPPASQLMHVDNDCVKHFLDLDLLSSGRITPFPATDNKCSMEPCDNEQFSSESSRQSNVSPPRSPTSSSENDCSSHETSCEHDFSMTTLNSEGNTTIDSPTLDNPDQSPLGQPSYLSLDSGFEELSSRYHHNNWVSINYDTC